MTTTWGGAGGGDDLPFRQSPELALQRSEQQLRLALAAGRLGIWEWDRRTGTVTWDTRMEVLFGIEPGTFDGTFEAYLAMIHPDDRDEVASSIEAVEANGDYEIEHRVVWPDGSVRWIHGSGRSLAGPDGVASGMIGVATDVTVRREADAERQRLLQSEAAARRKAEELRARSEFLTEVIGTISESLDLDERIHRLARIAVPRFADACAIYLLDDDGESQLREILHRDPVMTDDLRRMLGPLPLPRDAEVGSGAAIREARTWSALDISDDLLDRIAADGDQRALLHRLQPRSAISVPLLGRAGPLGAMTFLATGERRFTDDDVDLAEAVCRRAGIAIENALLIRIQEQIEVRLRFQTALLEAQNEAGIEGVLIVGPDGDILSHNQRFLDVWRFDREVADGATDDDLLALAAAKVAEPSSFLPTVRRAYRERRGGLLDELALADGRILERHGAPLYGAAGEYFGWAWYFRDVTDDRLNRAELAAVGQRFASLARTLQQSLLPPALPEFPGVDLAARYHPALEGLEVGGDFYDVFAVGEAWMLVIGDVCGKGATAAALTALVRYTIRAASMHAAGPAEVLTELNAAMLAHRPAGTDDQFATVCCVRLEPGASGTRATVACGGHPAPLVVRADGTNEEIQAQGTLIGLFDDVAIEASSIVLAPGDTLVAMTDGVLEARDGEGREIDEIDLPARLAALAGRTAGEIAEAVETLALDHQGGLAHDDIAVLVARVIPTDATP